MSTTLYQGDDLINVIHVNVNFPEGTDPEIEYVDVQVGCIKKRYEHPDYPFYVSIYRDESVKLSDLNPCYACVWYWAVVDGERKLLKKTCIGTLVLETNPEVIGGCCKC